MTITEFLLARIAEDEAVARANMAGGPFGTSYRRGVGGSLLVPPARVLAECEAKRRIVEREGERLGEEWRRRADEHRQMFNEWFSAPHGPTLRDLASIYADHPDFDEAWRA